MSFKSILNPTDFSSASNTAFIHSLKLALAERAKLTIMYTMVEDKSNLDWDKFPVVEDILSEWGLIKDGYSISRIEDELGLKVQKIIGTGQDVVDSVMEVVTHQDIDLIVLSTQGREGLPRWIRPSMSEPISRKSMVPTLFVPEFCKPFVNAENGEINLDQILLPVDHSPPPQRALEFASNMSRIYAGGRSMINIVHVLDKDQKWEKSDMPDLEIPDDISFNLRFSNRTESIDMEVVDLAKEIEANLIVIATEGHRGFLDALFGSTSEQVVRHSPCPVLAVPVHEGHYLLR